MNKKEIDFRLILATLATYGGLSLGGCRSREQSKSFPKEPTPITTTIGPREKEKSSSSFTLTVPPMVGETPSKTFTSLATETPSSTETFSPPKTSLPTEVIPSPTETSLPTPTETNVAGEEKKDYLAFLQELQKKVSQKREERAEKDPDYERRVNKELNQNRVNFLFLGLDCRSESQRGQSSFRADAPVVISLNTKTGYIEMLRIPRDLHAPEVDDLTSEYQGYPFRINAVTVFGDLEDARRVFEDATGLSQDFCFSLDFEAFRDVIDALGGVTLDVDPEFVERYAEEINEWLEGEIKAGQQHLNGKLAFDYVHWRKKDSDYARGQRQMQMVEAIAQTAVAKIKEDPISTTFNLSRLFLELKREGGLNFSSEFSIVEILGLVSNLRGVNLELATDNFVSHDPWNNLVCTPWSATPEGDTLEYKERYQQFFCGFLTEDPNDPLDYWQPLRDYIAQNFSK